MVRSFIDIQKMVIQKGKAKIAVAGADGEAVLEAIKQAREKNIIDPVLIGNAEKIKKIAHKVRLNLDKTEIIDEIEETRIAQKSVELVDKDICDGLMKGKLSTSVLLKSVLDKKYNLTTGKLLSHIAVLEIPSYHKLIMITDGGMVIKPTFEQKKQILLNGVHVFRKLGLKKLKVAVLAAIEKVNPDMPETADAHKLAKLSDQGEFQNVIIEGPMAVDIALSPQAAKIKGVDSKISGEPDIFIVPDIACGNIFAKGLWHFAKAKIGGLIAGARKPIILLSRSDNAETKLNSIALSVLTR